MATDIKLVILNDDETYTSSIGSHYSEFRRDADEVAEAGERRELLGFADYSVEVDDIVRAAKSAAEYVRAVTRGQLLEWIAESGENLANDLVKAGLLEPGERDDFLDADD